MGMKPVALGIAVIAVAWALMCFAVSALGALPPGMHLATVVREDTLIRLDRTPATRALDSLDSVITERRKK